MFMVPPGRGAISGPSAAGHLGRRPRGAVAGQDENGVGRAIDHLAEAIDQLARGLAAWDDARDAGLGQQALGDLRRVRTDRA